MQYDLLRVEEAASLGQQGPTDEMAERKYKAVTKESSGSTK